MIHAEHRLTGNEQMFKHLINSKITRSFLLLAALVILSQNVLARSISPFPDKLATISNFRGQNNLVLYFYITGSSTGSLWGTDIYTDDSSVAKAAVHAGLLAPGQSGVVKVTVLPGQNSYNGTSAHGVTSTRYDKFDGSFKISADDGGDNSTIPAPADLTEFRDRPGEVYLFSLTANKNGGIWGTNVYTADSSLKSVAVHAGVLRDGESGVIRVVTVTGQGSYLGSVQNGVNSNSYTKYADSYAVSNAGGTTPLLFLPGSPQNPLPNPGNLSNFKDLLGGAYYFTVTGINAGSLWGTDFYTSDSPLATAVVHAGVLGLNQSGTVKVTIGAGKSSYASSTRNGITSSEYGAFASSYSVASADGSLGSIPVINSADTANYVVGQSFRYQISASNNPLDFNATGLPKGLSIDRNNGLITGAPSLTGRFLVDLQVVNKSGASSKTLILDSAGTTTPPVINPPNPPTSSTSTEDCLFAWAESHFPVFFNPANQKTEQGFGYVYRFYSGTNTYLGIFQGIRIDLLQLNGSSSAIQTVGTVQDFKLFTGCQ